MMGRFAGKITLNMSAILVLSLFCSMFVAPNLAADQLMSDKDNFIYTSDERPDPFLPLLSSGGMVQDLGPSAQEEMTKHVSKIFLRGIMWDETMPIAMINNKMRKVGDVVENLTIQRINENSIILGYEELTHEIILIKKAKIYDQGGVE